MTKVCIIAAVSENDAIGAKNSLLWDLPEDLKHFKDITLGHPVIMGRKTFESLNKKPLPGRTNIVITSDKNFQQKGVISVNSLEAALKVAKKMDRDEVFVIGGGKVYEEAMEFAEYLYITEVHREYSSATVFFPKISSKKWKLVKEEETKKTKNGTLKYTFKEYEKI